jgi:hypothetical protein
MKLSILLLIAIVAINHSVLANSGNPSHHKFSDNIGTKLKANTALYTAPEKVARICSCQILRVASNNDNEQLIAVFAEGTNKGNLSAAYSVAGALLQKEKKFLENQFYSKVKLEEKLTAGSDCNLLYKNIKVKYNAVKLYEVLDADVLSQVKN